MYTCFINVYVQQSLNTCDHKAEGGVQKCVWSSRRWSQSGKGKDNVTQMHRRGNEDEDEDDDDKALSQCGTSTKHTQYLYHLYLYDIV